MKQEIIKRLHQAKREDLEETLARVINLCLDPADWTGSIYRSGWTDSRTSLFDVCNLERFI